MAVLSQGVWCVWRYRVRAYGGYRVDGGTERARIAVPNERGPGQGGCGATTAAGPCSSAYRPRFCAAKSKTTGRNRSTIGTGIAFDLALVVRLRGLCTIAPGARYEMCGTELELMVVLSLSAWRASDGTRCVDEQYKTISAGQLLPLPVYTGLRMCYALSGIDVSYAATSAG
eukprot:1084582-Rhodomonas_salina.2